MFYFSSTSIFPFSLPFFFLSLFLLIYGGEEGGAHPPVFFIRLLCPSARSALRFLTGLLVPTLRSWSAPPAAEHRAWFATSGSRHPTAGAPRRGGSVAPIAPSPPSASTPVHQRILVFSSLSRERGGKSSGEKCR